MDGLMEINRRGFLRLLGIASAGLAVDPARAVLARNEVYVNQRLGIAFQAPQRWHFYSVSEMEGMYDAQLFRAEFAEVEELMSELKNQPLVALGKYPAEQESIHHTFSPSIVIRLELNEEELSLEEMISGSDLFLSQWTHGYKSISVAFDQVCGYPAALGKYRYIFEAEGMKDTPIVGRSCLIEIDRYCYSINMYNYDPEDMEISSIFDRFLTSIQLL